MRGVPSDVFARRSWIAVAFVVLLAADVRTPSAQAPSTLPELDAILLHVNHELARRPALGAVPRARSDGPWKVAIAAIEPSWDARLDRATCERALQTGIRADLGRINGLLGREHFRVAAIGGHDIGLVVGDPEIDDARLVKRLRERESAYPESRYVAVQIGLGPGHHYRWHEIRSYFDRQSNQLSYSVVNRGWYPGPIDPGDCRWFAARDVVLSVSWRMERAIGGGKLVSGTRRSLEADEYHAFRAAAFCAQLGFAGEDLRRCARDVADLLVKPT